MNELLSFLNTNSGLLTIIGWLITIISWVIIFWLGTRGSKISQRNSVRLEIYKEIQKARLVVDDSAIELGVLIRYSFPFIEMSWPEKGFIKDKNPYQIWSEYTKKVSDAIPRFSEAVQAFLNNIEIWISIMPSLKTAKNTLNTRLSGINQSLWDYLRFLNDQPMKNTDWKKWDRDNIEKAAEKMDEEFIKQIAILNDFVVLSHNELIKPIFGKKRKYREDFNIIEPQRMETLTKKGIKLIKYRPTEIALMQKSARDGSIKSQN